jgi:hypothetical protein
MQRVDLRPRDGRREEISVRKAAYVGRLDVAGAT